MQVGEAPLQGFGRMWQKSYQVHLPAGSSAAEDLIATWKQRFPDADEESFTLMTPQGHMFAGWITGPSRRSLC